MFADGFSKTVPRGEEGATVEEFNIVIQTQAVRKDGKRFELTRKFTIGRRGWKIFVAAMEQWLDREMAKTEKSDFEFDTSMLGKPLFAEVVYREENGKEVAKVTGFYPAVDQAITVLPDFVREKDKPQAVHQVQTAAAVAA